MAVYRYWPSVRQLQNDSISRIVTELGRGANITAGRNEIDYIVTEFGRVRLRGLSLKEGFSFGQHRTP